MKHFQLTCQLNSMKIVIEITIANFGLRSQHFYFQIIIDNNNYAQFLKHSMSNIKWNCQKEKTIMVFIFLKLIYRDNFP